MKKTFLAAVCLTAATPAIGGELDELKQEMQQLKNDYNQRMQTLEKRLDAAESKAAQAQTEAHQARRSARPPKTANAFNPALSLILNGRITSFSNSPDDYTLPGFALGTEAGIGSESFSLGESEITFSANTDQHWRGQMTLALADDAGETATELEEAYIETLGLGNGLSLRAGRFYSGIGYLNGKHAHAWNFNDAPLIYRGLFGNQLKQDGLRLSWLLPTDRYFEIGAEAGNGRSFPAGGEHSSIGDWAAFAKTGGDIGDSQAWQLGISHWRADDIDGRESQSHSFSGNSRINAIDLVYKWAPHGNTRERNLVLQAEYFQRSEDGLITVDELGGSTYTGTQSGWYAEGVYQFMPQWRLGLRHDHLNSSNQGDNAEIMQASGLLNEGHDPYRNSVMLDWSPSEFSRIRVQYNRDHSGFEIDNQAIVQYTQALGTHGAHQF